jgi:hypothetical protein
MSRIDDAFTRANGGSGQPSSPKPGTLSGFVSEDKPAAPLAPSSLHAPPFLDPPAPPRPAPVAPPTVRVAVRPQTKRRQTVQKLTKQPLEKPAGLRQAMNLAGFAGRAVLRHKLLVCVCFLLTFGATIGLTLLVPKSYDVEVKLLALRSGLMASLSNPGRAVPWDADAPMHAAAETVLRRDNLISLIRQTDLVNEWKRRAPILLLGDRLKARFLGREQTPDETLDAIVHNLEANINVAVTPGIEGTITIAVRWHDPQMAFMLVERAQRAFLDARQVAEARAIGDAISILERYAQSLDRDLKQTLEALARERPPLPSQLRHASDLVVRASEFVRSMPSADLVDTALPSPDLTVDPGSFLNPRLDRLKGQIATKRGELQNFEEQQKQQLDMLQGQLNAARAIYTPNHPTIQTLQQNVAQAQQNSSRVIALRNELDRLEMAYDDQSAADAERLIQAELGRRGPARSPTAPRRVRGPIVASASPITDAPPARDEMAEFSTLRLRTELAQLRNILERTDSARIELAVSRGGFKHRYSVVTPAEEPSNPAFPKARRIIFAGLFASFAFAIAAAIAMDVMSPRFLEIWQVQRQLDIPFLGTVR